MAPMGDRRIVEASHERESRAPTRRASVQLENRAGSETGAPRFGAELLEPVFAGHRSRFRYFAFELNH